MPPESCFLRRQKDGSIIFNFFLNFFWNYEFVCITFAGAFEGRYFKTKF